MIKKENGMYTHVEEAPHLKEAKGEEKISQEAILNGFKKNYMLAALCLATASTEGTVPIEWYKLLNDMCDRVITLTDLEA